MNIANNFFRAAVTLFAVGVAIGVYMAQSGDRTLVSTHAHVNLLGWVSLFLYGAFYRFFPTVAETRLARAHFWTAVVGTPVMMFGLALLNYGVTGAAIPFLMAGEVLVVSSVVIFVLIAFKATARQAAKQGATASAAAE